MLKHTPPQAITDLNSKACVCIVCLEIDIPIKNSLSLIEPPPPPYNTFLVTFYLFDKYFFGQISKFMTKLELLHKKYILKVLLCKAWFPIGGK